MKLRSFVFTVIVLAGAGGAAWVYRAPLLDAMPAARSFLEAQLGADMARQLGLSVPADAKAADGAKPADAKAADGTKAADGGKPADGGKAGARKQGDVPPASVVTAVVEKADFPIRKRAIGYVEAPASVGIRSRLDSQIVEQHVTDGQFVKKGDLLFTLDDREVQALIAKDEANLARDQANHERAQTALVRIQQLIDRNAGTQQALDQAVADEKVAAATVLADEAALTADKLRLAYTKITSPIDGRAGAVQVTPGNVVSANGATNLVTITQVKPIRVSFTLPERELPALKTAMGGEKPPRVTVSRAGTAGLNAEGTLNFIDSSVDRTSGTITAKAAFANDDLSLWPGQYVDVELETGVLTGVVVVPTVAVQASQQGSFVFVVKQDDTVEIRPVEVLMADGDRTGLAKGLDAGERVVIDGQIRLKNGSKVRDGAAKPVGAPLAVDQGKANGSKGSGS